MSLAEKLRWKRTINRLRFLYEEYKCIKDLAHEGATQFQDYYETFCAENDVDLQKLNEQHASRISEAYGPDPEIPSQIAAEAESADLVLYEPRDEEIVTDYQLTQDELELHEIFNKVFKKLALIYHPDKLKKTLTADEKDDMLNMFKEISDAFEKRRYFVLLDYAEKNNISIPRNYKQQTRWMKQEVIKLENKINHEKKTYNYLFAEADSDTDKNQIIRQFLKQLFDLQF